MERFLNAKYGGRESDLSKSAVPFALCPESHNEREPKIISGTADLSIE